ncbi:hypothetical protein [Desulfatibacillum aliphaticivorans]|uniref:hypothetical protein n=1 Tax=Desulfatibacillum aliphaticivorans TaxID=218208 RepID=UPI0004221D0F|nr:hypothetical protein [Desulfatibacillum aliphaticivorans]
MGRSQMQAVMGRRLPRADRDINETMAARLPAYYQAQQDRAFEEKAFNANQDWRKKQEALDREKLEVQKDQAKKANLISLANLAASYYTGKEQNDALSQAINADSGAVDDSATEAAKMGAGETAKFFSSEGAGDAGNWVGALKDHYVAIPAGILAGTTLGADLGRDYIPFGGKREREIMGSAAVSGATAYLASGGDVYSTVLSAVGGGAVEAISGGDWW